MLDLGMQEKNMEMVKYSSRMVVIIKENFIQMKFMVLELIIGKMKRNTTDNGSIIKCQETEDLSGKMDTLMKENFRMVNIMGLVQWSSRMVPQQVDIGRKEENMVSLTRLMRMGYHNKLNGIWEKEQNLWLNLRKSWQRCKEHKNSQKLEVQWPNNIDYSIYLLYLHH